MEISVLEEAVGLLEKAAGELSPRLISKQRARAALGLVARAEKLLGFTKAALSARVGDPVDLARVSGTSVGRARQTIEIGRRLEEEPRLAEAVRRAEVSLDQAEEIAKTEAVSPGSTDELLDVARSEAFHVLKKKARGIRLLAQDGPDLARRQHEARALRHWITDLGMVHIEADLEPHVGVPIVSRLEEVAGRLERKARSAGEPAQPFGRRLADALPAVLEGAKGGGRPEMVVLVSHGVAERGWTDVGDDEKCMIPGVGPISPQAAKEIAQDAFLTGLFHDGKDLRNIKRWTRHIPADVLSALRLGEPPDFEGLACADCGNRYRLEFDHIEPCASLGPTSYANLKPRCSTTCHPDKTRADRRAGKLSAAPRKYDHVSPALDAPGGVLLLDASHTMRPRRASLPDDAEASEIRRPSFRGTALRPRRKRIDRGPSG
jgi:hypothetical protein